MDNLLQNKWSKLIQQTQKYRLFNSHGFFLFKTCGLHYPWCILMFTSLTVDFCKYMLVVNLMVAACFKPVGKGATKHWEIGLVSPFWYQGYCYRSTLPLCKTEQFVFKCVHSVLGMIIFQKYVLKNKMFFVHVSTFQFTTNLHCHRSSSWPSGTEQHPAE